MSNILNSSSVMPWDVASGLYTFPPSLTLSNDAAIEHLLADIPVFSVGLLSFGVSTFFFVMKRVNPLSVILYFSVFFAFTAAVFDLGQILTCKRGNSDIATNLNAVTGLVAAREILFAVSVGLRFLFFWLFVAEPPRGESVKATPSDPMTRLFTEEMHSGAWGRWGITGIILKWALLAVTFTILILQMIWRIVPSENRLGPLYGAEAAMEIIASALFVIKLLLNTLITPIIPRSKTLRRYAAMMFALSINLGLGIGNVAMFAFTESTLGRFLLAVEFYVLIVFLLISTFYDYVPKPAEAEPKPRAAFEGVPEIKRGSTFRVKPIDARTTDNPVLVIDNSYQNHPYNDTRPSRPSRSSTASRLSSWIVSRRMSRRRSVGSGDRTQLWNQDEAERGQSPVDPIATDDRESLYNSPMEQSRETQSWKDPMATTILDDPLPKGGEPTVSRWTATTVNSTSESTYAKNARNSDPDLQPPRMPHFDSTAYSTGSYYGDRPRKSEVSTPSVAGTSRKTESPVYGLEGIVPRNNPGRQTPNSVARTRSSAMSFTELLRQQTELDNSIAALRLLSPQEESGQVARVQFGLQSASVSPTGPKDLNRTNSTVTLPSSSRRSEFSLSNFPEPPMTFTATANGIPSPTSTLKARFDSDDERRSELVMKPDDSTSLPLPRMPALNDYPSTPQSMPDSPGRNSGDTRDMSNSTSRMKVDSAGTQYDVTSFIGNLTTPGFKKSPAFDNLTVIDSEDGVSETNGNTSRVTTMQVPSPNSASAPRPEYVDPAIAPSALDLSGPTTKSNGASSSLPQADIEKPVPALPQPTTKSALEPQANAPNRPALVRNISANILPLFSINNSSNSQSKTAPYLSTGGNVVRTADEVGASGRRRAPPVGAASGLPARPRLAISGPKAPPQDGKGDQAPSAFEKPRPPPLILQQANGKPPGIGASF